MLKLKQEGIREHLLMWFESNELVSFPTSDHGTSISKSSKKHFVITVYCVSQMPEPYDKDMIMCDDCEKWFHCVWALTTSTAPDTWKCCDCSK